jgi:hypothetical protein
MIKQGLFGTVMLVFHSESRRQKPLGLAFSTFVSLEKVFNP